MGRRLGGPTIYNCSTCRTNVGLRAMLGCDGTIPTGPWTENLITGEPLTECPLRTIRRLRETEPALMAEYDRYLTTYYPLYLDGHLLVEGGVSDQPARYLDYMLAIRQMDAAVNAKELALAEQNGDEGEA